MDGFEYYYVGDHDEPEMPFWVKVALIAILLVIGLIGGCVYLVFFETTEESLPAEQKILLSEHKKHLITATAQDTVIAWGDDAHQELVRFKNPAHIELLIAKTLSALDDFEYRYDAVWAKSFPNYSIKIERNGVTKIIFMDDYPHEYSFEESPESWYGNADMLGHFFGALALLEDIGSKDRYEDLVGFISYFQYWSQPKLAENRENLMELARIIAEIEMQSDWGLSHFWKHTGMSKYDAEN